MNLFQWIRLKIRESVPPPPPSGEKTLFLDSAGDPKLLTASGEIESLGGAAGMTSFDIDADSGTAETVTDGETVNFLGGTGISSVVSAPDTITVNLEDTAVTPASYTNTNLTVDQQGRITAASNGTVGMTSFDAAADSGSAQTITNGNTLTIAGGTGLSSVASATDTVTLNLDNTAVTPASYTNADITVDAQGRITAAANGVVALGSEVSGTLPIANGGTGQTTQTAAFDALSPTTTKGDLIAHNGTDNVRVAVGADGTIPVADSSDAEGIAYKGGYVAIIAAGKLGSDQTTITLSSIPDDYQDLILVIDGRSNSSNAVSANAFLTFNADTGTNYSRNYTVVNNAGTGTNTTANNQVSAAIIGAASISTATSGYFSHSETTIHAYSNAAISRAASFFTEYFNSATDHQRAFGSLAWENVANAITSIELTLGAGDWLTGTTYALYGRGTKAA